MITFSRSPRLLREATVAVDQANPAPNVMLFHYDPYTLTRTLQVQAVGGDGGDRSEAIRVKGAPAETVRLEVTDQTKAASRIKAGARKDPIYD